MAATDVDATVERALDASKVGHKLKAVSVGGVQRYILKAGYVTKLGQMVKNWKTRWLVLLDNGQMYYYKREVPVGQEKPQGELDVTRDCVGILTGSQVHDQDLVRWPEDTPPNCGFALKMRSGRTFFMACESWREAERWIASIAGVAPNVRYEDGGDAVRAIMQSRPSVRRPGENKSHVDLIPDETKTEVDQDGNRVCYVHKVVGGMVIKEKHVIEKS
ncbi:uncharacterized protein MONBRDRAFT_38808 [Monosiga brevicollis MX1]|uniref:PH domain-containing protein n=1 Tax=Monosiga brevicollis TaxID=81824 RepID=A9VA95_MONBE|nr:uncharacterized protein MONBRDRAFT_38808 [Monosiga brevicollis MX1]EDQ85448.1 predicted protein [Monosiga brevicollis MX1]|eukprot:XP_001749639.1 hypothetical protein [Monosiga brevicollis MX1]